MSEECKY